MKPYRFLWLALSVVFGLLPFGLGHWLQKVEAQPPMWPQGQTAQAPQGSFWVPLNGPLGGWVAALTVQTATGQVFVSLPAYDTGSALVAGSRSFRSSNGGLSWTPIFSTGFESRFMVAFAPSGTMLFAGTANDGIFRSLNGGDTWSTLTNYTPTAGLSALGVNPATTQVYATTRGQGVWRSLNGGQNWAAVNTGLSTLTTTALAFTPNGNLYLGTQSGVFTSTTGASWAAQNAGLTDLAVTSLALNPTGTVLAATQNAGVFRLDAGASAWVSASGGLPDLTTAHVFYDAASNAWFVVTTAGTLFRSLDAGNSWAQVTGGLSLSQGSVRPLRLASGPGGSLFLGSGAGVYFSNDGGQAWAPRNTGINATTIRRLVVQPNGTILAASTTNGVYTSTDGGQSWGMAGPLGNQAFSLDRAPGGEVYVGYYINDPNTLETHIYRTADNGATWLAANPNPSLPVNVVSGFGFANGRVYAGSAWGSGVLSSTDGTVWASAGMTRPTVGLSSLPNGTVYASTEGFGTFRLAPTQTVWVNVGMTNVQAYRFISDSLGNLYAPTTGQGSGLKGVFRSTNNGFSWTAVFTTYPAYDMALGPDGTTLYVATDTGVWVSTDQGAGWSSLNNSGMPTLTVFGLYVGADSYLYAGTNGFGVYRSANPLGGGNTPPTIISALAATATHYLPFSYTINVVGSPPMSFAAALPPGFGLAGNVISGTPFTTATLPIVITVTNQYGQDVQTLTVTVRPLSPTLTVAALIRGAVGQPFTYPIYVTGTAPFTFTASPLPAGLALYQYPTYAVIAGTPTTTGTTNVTVRAYNAGGQDVRGVAMSITTVPLTPLIDLAQGFYLGQFAGGLYSGTNTMPAAHAAEGLARARLIVPRDVSGTITSTGRYVLLSIGMSNATQEFCHQNPNVATVNCNPWTFAGQANADGAVNHTTLALANGARGGMEATQWLYPTMTEYSRIQSMVLAPQGLSEAQVQVVWVKLSNALSPTTPRLPDPQADAYVFEARLGQIMRALKVRYPNLQMVLISSRIYGGFGYAESQSYEVGYAIQFLMQAQMRQMATGQIDPIAGDLNYTTVAPWVAWSSYLWADGLHPNSEGLLWDPLDFEGDWVHPSQLGETKVGSKLLEFFKTAPYTACWFLAGEVCGVERRYLPWVRK